MKTEVKLVISNPIPCTCEEDYSHLGIEVSLVEGKLAALKTVVEHDIGAGHADIISKARSATASLLSLIELGHGCPANIEEVHTHAVEPASEVSIGLGFVKVAATLVRQIPMPPANLVANLGESTRLQLNWYLHGQNGSSAIERIKNYYNVLEEEKRLTKKSATPYEPPADARFLRNAVSHPDLNDPKVVDYLQKNLGASKIDPKNEAHIRFLEGQVLFLQSEAQRVLDGKVPKWW